MGSKPMIEGTQSIRRVAIILRALGSAPVRGMSLAEIVRATGFNKATAHRILSALISEDLVSQETQSRRYHLGLGLFILGSAVSARFEIRSLAQPALARICNETDDTVFLSVRRGFDAICLDRLEGAFPIKTLTLSAGSVRPLGVGAGSLALLAALQDGEIEEVLADLAPRLANYPKLSPNRIRTLVSETRAQQYALNDGGVIDGMSAIGVPVLNDHGQPIAALSVAAISERMGPDRRPMIVECLWREAKWLSKLYSAKTLPAARAAGHG